MSQILSIKCQCNELTTIVPIMGRGILRNAECGKLSTFNLRKIQCGFFSAEWRVKWRQEIWERFRRKTLDACDLRFWRASYRMFTRCDRRGERSQVQLWLPLLHELNMINSCDRPCNCRTDYTNWSQSHWPMIMMWHMECGRDFNFKKW